VFPNFCICCLGTACTLNTTALFGTPPFTYLWSNGATTPSITTGIAGLYTVTITDANGCSTTCSGQVVVDTFGNCGIVPNNASVCNGGSVVLTTTHVGGLAPFRYVWSTGESTSSITVTEPGIYTVSVADANGCVSSFSTTVESCDPCVTRDAAFWFSHVVPPPRISLGPGVSPATLQNVFLLEPGGLLNLGFLQVSLNQALGLFYGNPVATGDGVLSDVCAARKQLSIELIAAIANTKLLNADSSRCGVQDPNMGDFILIDTLISEAQAATQAEPNVFDCTMTTAWVNQMAFLTSLLHIFNSSGVTLPLPANEADTGIGPANVNYIHTNQTDSTTAANCACPNG
jgi:hypothetical protein